MYKGIGVGDSPIEIKMYSGLRKLFSADVIQDQKQIGPYRADFYIELDGKKVVIECDGEDFHQDYEHDAKRDDYMRSLGIEVMRFSGSRIFRRWLNCAFAVASRFTSIQNTEAYQRVEQKLSWRENQRMTEAITRREDCMDWDFWIDPETGDRMYS